MFVLPWIILPAVILVAPGLGILALLGEDQTWDFNQRVIVAGALSIAFYPLVLLYASLVNLKIGPSLAWGVLLGMLALTGWRRIRRGGINFLWRQRQVPEGDRALAPSLILWGVFALVLGVRLWVVKDLPVPKWGDSYHHTLITQLLLNNGGLFQSWAPYAPMQTFTYHYAFHAVCAFFAWVSGLDSVHAVIIGAQWLNAWAALAVYPFTVKITGNRWAGIIAVLAAGLLSPMPMYYVNWGRYTQLTGQILLTLLLFLWASALDDSRWNWGRLALSAFVIAGLWVAHYVVTIFALLWIAAWWLTHACESKPRLTLWAQAIGMWVFGVLLVAPWLVNLVLNYLPVVLHAQIKYTPEYIVSFFKFPPLFFFPIHQGFYAPVYLLLVVSLGTAIGLWRRERAVWSLVLWGISLLGAANLYHFNLPVVNGLVDSFSVFIAGYIPISILAGVTMHYVLAAPLFASRLGRLAFGGVVAISALIGMSGRLSVMNEDYTLVTSLDLQAMAWIREHTPPDAKFLVNTFFATGPKGFIAGSDGGWWLPLLAQRATNLPPANYIYEQMPNEAWTELYALAEMDPLQMNSIQSVALLRHYRVGYIYLGSKEGRFKAEHFQSPYYTRIYDATGVTILAVQPAD